MEETILKAVIHHYPSVQGIYLFGSYQRGDAWEDSDVDIAVLLPHVLAKQERHLGMSDCRFQLEHELGKRVDLVNIRQVSTVFQFQIVTTGRLIFSGDENAVDEFEMLTFSFYQKLNEERKEILEEFYKTGRAYNL